MRSSRRCEVPGETSIRCDIETVASRVSLATMIVVASATVTAMLGWVTLGVLGVLGPVGFVLGWLNLGGY